MKNFLDWLDNYDNSGYKFTFFSGVTLILLMLFLGFVAWSFNDSMFRAIILFIVVMLIPVAAYWIDTKEQAK